MGLNSSRRRKTQINNSNFIIIDDESSSKAQFESLKNSQAPSLESLDHKIELKKYVNSNISFPNGQYKMVSQTQKAKANSFSRKASEYWTAESKVSNFSEKSTSTYLSEVSVQDFQVLDKQSPKITHMELPNQHKGYNMYSLTPTDSTQCQNINCKEPIYNFCTAVYDKDTIKNPFSNQSEPPKREVSQNASTDTKLSIDQQICSPEVASNNKTVTPASSATIEKSQSFIKRFFDKIASKTYFFRKQTSEHFVKNCSTTTETCIKDANIMVQDESENSLDNQTDSSHDSDTSLHYETFSDPSMVITLSNTEEELSNVPFPKKHLHTTSRNMLQHGRISITEPDNEESYDKDSLEAEFIMTTEKSSSLLDILKAQLPANSLHKLPIYSNKETQTQDTPDPVRKMSNPNVTIIKSLEIKYRKHFKSLDEILHMPPKQQILFITKGEGAEGPKITTPARVVFSYEQFLKSFRSGI